MVKLLSRRAAAYVELHDLQHAQADLQEVSQNSQHCHLHVICMSAMPGSASSEPMGTAPPLKCVLSGW